MWRFKNEMFQKRDASKNKMFQEMWLLSIVPGHISSQWEKSVVAKHNCNVYCRISILFSERSVQSDNILCVPVNVRDQLNLRRVYNVL